MRSAMWAFGSQEMTREAGGKSITSLTAATADMMFEWLSSTPFGGPVVPEV